MRILFTIAYDGTAYCGWQKQRGQPTVQETLETGLTALFRRPVAILGASRTDAGVHARGQRAVFSLLPGDLNIPPHKLPYAVNGFLPDDIRVTAAETVPDTFHPIRDAIQKTYAYRIWNAPVMDPLALRHCEHVYLPLDVDKMRLALPPFIGEHDFMAFRATGGFAKTTVRTIFALTLDRADACVIIRVTGNGFLYNMVRIIAGTLIAVGLSRIAPSDIPAIITSLDRTRAGKTAAAKGLVLLNIRYGGDAL